MEQKSIFEQYGNGKYTLVVNYPNLSAGGIERTLANLIRYSLEKGHRVIWITNHFYLERVAFQGITDNSNLEIVIWEKFKRLLGLPKLYFNENETVIMITCRATQYVISESIKRKAKVKEFKHFFLIAHYTGNVYYPDRWVKSPIGHKFVYNFYSKIVKRMIDNNCLRAFSLKHLKYYEDYYNVPIIQKQEKVLPDFVYYGEFLYDNITMRCKERNEKFIITTCARFEFPHKGYILGLVDSFAEIRRKYHQVSLQIVGYGEGANELRQKIEDLPQYIKDSITLLGMVSPDELEKYYKASHLIIGLAGAIMGGARSGIPSLVTRHYCYTCETYGFYEDVATKTLSDEPGEDIVPFIEKCILMSDREYIQHAKQAYMSVQSLTQYEPDYFFNQNNVTDNVTVHFPGETMIGRIIYLFTEVKDRLFGA